MVAEAMTRQIDVSLLLPREARPLQVDAYVVLERLLIRAVGVGNGGILYAFHACHRNSQGLVLRGIGGYYVVRFFLVGFDLGDVEALWVTAVSNDIR
jgi:hypothetical protein